MLSEVVSGWQHEHLHSTAQTFMLTVVFRIFGSVVYVVTCITRDIFFTSFISTNASPIFHNNQSSRETVAQWLQT